ncbi:MAG: GNAT family N-acetyltransferase [Candidatus Woesearchaeota archaeon]
MAHLFNLDAFLKNWFARKIVDEELTDDKVRQFIVALNLWIKDDDFAETYGFWSSGQLDLEKGRDLAERIRETNAHDREDIEYRLTEEVPYEMLRAFGREAGAGSDWINRTRKKPIKYGAFRKHEIVGFIAAGYWNNGRIISVPSLYTTKSYRKKGIASQLVEQVITKAREEQLDGVDISHCCWATVYLLENMAREWNQKPDNVRALKILECEEAIYADIRFTDTKAYQEKQKEK